MNSAAILSSVITNPVAVALIPEAIYTCGACKTLTASLKEDWNVGIVDTPQDGGPP